MADGTDFFTRGAPQFSIEDRLVDTVIPGLDPIPLSTLITRLAGKVIGEYQPERGRRTIIVYGSDSDLVRGVSEGIVGFMSASENEGRYLGIELHSHIIPEGAHYLPKKSGLAYTVGVDEMLTYKHIVQG